MSSVNIFIVVLLIISVINNFWMYHNHHSNITNMAENIKYKNFVIFYKPNKLRDPSDKINSYINKLGQNNQTVILSKNNDVIDFNSIDFDKVNSINQLN